MMKWEPAGEAEVLEEDQPQCHFAHHKSNITWPGIEPGLNVRPTLMHSNKYNSFLILQILEPKG
jgi:hypothetical protein